MQVAAVAKVPVSKVGKGPHFAVVVQKNLDNGESAKIRLGVPCGTLGTSYSAKLGNNSTLVLSSVVNVRSIRDGVTDDSLKLSAKFAVSAE